ncbi:hypothetical protein ONE63_008894 [Megalurothrips usitatus]|uniref:Peptidase S1 domain-containing protein n=1 Tax=Megalurothrips usitatus TaxID=439358 RepID=A0AAV7XKL5_9NEOP|nr:hypothetical protein ONE63_008894 [Megalurothrips usitatus]
MPFCHCVGVAGDYPYQVAVVPYSNPEDVHVCGGSLLAAKWVLSSASCVNYCRDASAHARRSNTFLRVILGAVSLTHDEPEQKWFTVADAVSHPDTKSDLILLRLNKRVAFSDYIQPVSLAGKSASDLADMRLTGWGSAESNDITVFLPQVALTSGTFARQCDRIYPTLFVRLDPFVDWIRATIGAERY